MKSETKTGSKSLAAKKIILCLIIVALGIFVVTQIDSLRKEKVSNYPEMLQNVQGTEQVDYDRVTLKKDGSFSYEFVSDSSHMKELALFFVNTEPNSCKGDLKLTLNDSGGKETASTSIKSTLISNESSTRFHLGGDSNSINLNRIVTAREKVDYGGLDLEKGQKYKLVVTAKGISSDGELDILMYKGEPKTKIVYSDLNMKIIFLFFAMILMTLAVILIPWEKIQRRIDLKSEDENSRLQINKIALRTMFVLTPFLCFFIMLKIMGMQTGQIIDFLFSLKGAANMIIIVIIWLLAYVIINRVRWSSIITTVVITLFCITNYALFQFRDYPLMASDFLDAGTGLQVAKSYSLTFNQYAIWCILLSVIWICLNIRFKSYKGLPLKMRLIPLALLVCLSLYSYNTLFKTDFIKKNKIYVSAFKPSGTYKRNGYALSFFVTVKNSFIEQPEGYSAEAAKKIESGFISDSRSLGAKVSVGHPNVIAIMNESFSDLSVLGDLKTNKDTVPFYRSLKENAVKGWMHTSVFGGGTANTEFEFLTGHSMINLPFRSVPFRTIIKDDTASLADTLKDQGYGGIVAFHPGLADSYNRHIVYPALGFDKVMSLEDLKKPEKIRDYVSDSYDYKVIENEHKKFRAKDKKTPFFMFNVTIQNHGGYKLDTGLVDAGVTITDNEQQEEEAQQALNLMKKSDEALKELIGYYKEVKEPTVIIMFGDHQPRVGNSFYKAVKKGSSELKYKVPFLIWANYDIKEKQNVEISANYLSAYTLNEIGLSQTGYSKYLLQLRNDYPVITGNCFVDKHGKMYMANKKNDFKELNDYSIVQYNGLVKKADKKRGFFRLK